MPGSPSLWGALSDSKGLRTLMGLGSNPNPATLSGQAAPVFSFILSWDDDNNSRLSGLKTTWDGTWKGINYRAYCNKVRAPCGSCRCSCEFGVGVESSRFCSGQTSGLKDSKIRFYSFLIWFGLVLFSFFLGWESSRFNTQTSDWRQEELVRPALPGSNAERSVTLSSPPPQLWLMRWRCERTGRACKRIYRCKGH